MREAVFTVSLFVFVIVFQNALKSAIKFDISIQKVYNTSNAMKGKSVSGLLRRELPVGVRQREADMQPSPSGVRKGNRLDLRVSGNGSAQYSGKV